MAFCNFCHQDTEDAAGCVPFGITYDGVEYERIKVGEAGDYYEEIAHAECRRCGAKAGYYHHFGCEMETCPLCNDFLKWCGCVDLDEIEPMVHASTH